MWPEVDCVFAMPEFGDQVLLSQQKVIQTGECRTDEEFFIELCRKAGWNFGYHDQREMMEEQIKIMKERRPELAGYTLDDLRERGFIAPERTYYNYKKNGFRTPSGKYEFASCVMKRYGLDPLPSWHEPQGTFVNSPETGEKYPLILITGGRQQSYFLTAYRQIRPLRDREPYPLVFMNPETADKYGIKERASAYRWCPSFYKEVYHGEVHTVCEALKEEKERAGCPAAKHLGTEPGHSQADESESV